MARLQIWISAVLLGATVVFLISPVGAIRRSTVFFAVVGLFGLLLELVVRRLKSLREESPVTIATRVAVTEIENRLSSLDTQQASALVRQLAVRGDLLDIKASVGLSFDGALAPSLRAFFDEYGSVGFKNGDARVEMAHLAKSGAPGLTRIGSGVDATELLADRDGGIWEWDRAEAPVRAAGSIWHWVLREAAQIYGVAVLSPPATSGT